MPSNTTTPAIPLADLNPTLFTPTHKGHSFSAAAATTTTDNYVLTDDVLMEGATLILVGPAAGDTYSLKIVDVDNVLALGANYVLASPITDFYVDETKQMQEVFKTLYMAKIKAGIYLQTSYTNTNVASSVQVKVNWKLHKVLV